MGVRDGALPSRPEGGDTPTAAMARRSFRRSWVPGQTFYYGLSRMLTPPAAWNVLRLHNLGARTIVEIARLLKLPLEQAETALDPTFWLATLAHIQREDVVRRLHAGEAHDKLCAEFRIPTFCAHYIKKTFRKPKQQKTAKGVAQKPSAVKSSLWVDLRTFSDEDRAACHTAAVDFIKKSKRGVTVMDDETREFVAKQANAVARAKAARAAERAEKIATRRRINAAY